MRRTMLIVLTIAAMLMAGSASFPWYIIPPLP
jgi:hypothetical protein